MRVVPRRPSEHFIYSPGGEARLPKITSVTSARRSLPRRCRGRRTCGATAYRALGCRDIARVDFRLKAGVPYFLEVNPLPGLNPIDSDLVLLAKGVGWSYERLIQTIFDDFPGDAFRPIRQVSRNSMRAIHARAKGPRPVQPARSPRRIIPRPNRNTWSSKSPRA